MKRLERIADFVEPGSVPVDIGSDHGELLKILMDRGVIDRAYATEVAKGPYHNIIQSCAGYNVQAFLTDGILGLDQDFNVAIIAGMGARTICKIIEQSEQRFRTLNYFILQPMKNVDLLREFLYKNSFTVLKEAVVFEKHYYHIITARDGKEEPYDFLVGKGLCQERDIFRNWLCYEIKKRKRYESKRADVQDEIKRLELALHSVLD